MTKNEYIKQMYAILSPMCAKYGYYNVAAGMIAQSIQEGWNSGLANKYFNYWGMKAGKGYKGRTVAMNNKAGNDPAVYRVFTSMAEGCEGYFAFLAYPRYQSLKNCASDAMYLDRIGPCGWNGNPGYGDRCKSHLKEVYNVLGNIEKPTTQWEIGKTYTTQQDLNVRRTPNGELVPIEELTEDAKKHAIVNVTGTAILKRGTRVTVKAIQSTGSCTWVQIPSGWVCAANSKAIYIL